MDGTGSEKEKDGERRPTSKHLANSVGGSRARARAWRCLEETEQALQDMNWIYKNVETGEAREM